MKKTKSPEKMLTEVELELMNILWNKGEGTVNEVLELLPKDRDLAYTSVSTILRILEQKGVLKTKKVGRGHVYIPEVEKSQYKSKAVRHVVDKVFDGAPSSLMKQLLGSVKLSNEEIQEIKALLDQVKEK